ncbi:Uncharacterized protein PECH_002340 [Penicillium ucsense]|uniref:Uncharacterized protein n=1 Tax=Penicillium ucsense TaxID=2839758 RepID=A0A8J8VX19_9EURO|nr:Uncharacterized protein PECM_001929 [Penicillium ucsense]KAF7730927.1 Uncharacterized protein PECH_002340 [Penicillium ucsense]
MATFGLLPSPPISESRPASTGPDASYFESQKEPVTLQPGYLHPPGPVTGRAFSSSKSIKPQAPKLQSHLSRKASEETIAYEKPPLEPPRASVWHAKSPEKRRTDVTNVHEAHSILIRQCEETLATSSPKEHPRPVDKQTVGSPSSHYSIQISMSSGSPKPQRPRTTTVSSEASWVPTNFSYCETWLQSVPHNRLDRQDHPRESNRRKCQIIEQDPPMPIFNWYPETRTLDEPVRFAVASKPKLVDISRQSSPSMGASIPQFAPPFLGHQPARFPMTPDQRQEEISAFSPDTPLDTPLESFEHRTEFEPDESDCQIEQFANSRDDDTISDPGSLTSDSVSSTVIGDKLESTSDENEATLQPEIRSGSVSPKASPYLRTHSPNHASRPSEDEKLEKQASWDYQWTLDDHEWSLGELEHSVKDFPRHMLRLASPVIVFLRKNDEKTLIRHFRTIFPTVADNLLDCLCAALIARNYLHSLSKLQRRRPSLSSRADSYCVEAVPAKAYSTLGIQLPTASPSRAKERRPGSRTLDLHHHVEKIIDRLLFAISGRSDATLKSAIEVLAQVLETHA